MPIFDVGSPGYQGPTTVGTASSARVWSGTNSALVTANPTAVIVRDVMIQNTGTAPIYLASGTQNTATASIADSGLAVPAGAIAVIQGWTATTNTTTSDVFAIAAYATGPSTAVAGLGTLISVV